MNTRRALPAFLALAVLASIQSGQLPAFDAIPELEPRANRHQYYSSHNSYARTATLSAQLDFYNVWEIELDVRFNNEGQTDPDDRYEIFHDCTTVGTRTLKQALSEIKGTRRFQDGLFFLNIELGDAVGPCDDWDDLPPETHDANVESIILAELGFSNIYRETEFTAPAPDDGRWPSVQELVRRGKHVIVHMVYQGNSGGQFFRRGTGVNASGRVIWNSDDEDASLLDLGDRHMARYYPSGLTGPGCIPILEQGDWDDAYANGFNFPSTNCVSDSGFLALRRRFHPPYPMYATNVANPLLQYGTPGSRFSGVAGLAQAVGWVQMYNARPPIAPSHTSRAGVIPILMAPGSYPVSSGGVRLEGPIVLQSENGAPVTIE